MMNLFKAVILLFISFTSGFSQSPGFFLENEEKTGAVPPFADQPKPGTSPTVTIDINKFGSKTPVSKYIYGNNVNPYMTQIVTEPALMNYITDLSPNVIRFPGGNLSSVFFWNAEKNQPPADAPAKLVDANGTEIDPGYWYGKNNESWTLSVDNYYQMLEETHNTGMITVNYGYARYSTATDPVASAAHHAAQWVRYDNGKTKFWEIGNESNGTWQAGHRINTADNKDGQPQIITGELYGKHFKVFADSMRKAANEIGAEIYIGAQLLAEVPATWWNNTDKTWNTGVFQESGNLPDFYIIHSYYTPYATNSNAAAILNSADKVTTEMMEFVSNAVATAGLEPKPVALTEWNIFAEGSKQQVSFINGMHAAIVLGELAKNRYGMAARWNFANGYAGGDDHGTFSKDEPNIPLWNPRPSYYYMYYFQKYFGDHSVGTTVNGSADVLAYGSTFSSGESGVVVVNKGTSSQVVELKLFNQGVGERYYYYTLTGGTDNGEFSLKVQINGSGPTLSAGGPSGYKAIAARSALIQGGITFTTPAKSVTYVLVDKGDGVITNIEAQKQGRINIAPNPARGSFKIMLPSNAFSKLDIIDTRGMKVFTRNIGFVEHQFVVNEHLPKGMYVVRLFKEGRVYVEKFIIE